MSDLTHGFSDTQLNDHSASDSIERILEEASVEGPLKECLLDGFKSEAGNNELVKFEEVLRASLASGVTPQEQIAHFIQHYPYECRLFKRGDEFRDKLKDAIENGSDEDYKQLHRAILPTPLGLAVKTHIFPSNPIKFIRFSTKVKPLDSPHYEVSLRLYGNSPFEMFVDQWLALDKADPARIQLLSPINLLKREWELLHVEEKTLERYEKLLKRLTFYQQQLICADEFTEARQLEYHSLITLDTGNKEIQADWFDTQRRYGRLMCWQRLRAEKQKSAEDSEEFLKLSFKLEKSFLEADCATDLLEGYIEASLEVVNWDSKRNGLIYGTVDLDRSLHELWCYSPHKASWLNAVDIELNQTSDQQKLARISHLLGRIGTGIIIPNFTRRGQNLNQDELREREILFEIPVEQTWLSQLRELQCAYLDRELHLRPKEAAELLSLLAQHFDNLEVLLKVADRLLATIWLFPDSEPTLSDIAGSYQAQRLLISHEPEKLLRALMQAFRKSQQPCCGEKLEYGAGSSLTHVEQSDSPPHWFLSVMISNCLRLPYAWKPKQVFPGLPEPEPLISIEELEERTSSLRKIVAEHCWKSLRLLKGESCNDEFYKDAQCTEPNPIWRQAYAKALSEIGLDLNGSVHKTLHFIRQKDPDESVRMAAANAYKAVRHQQKADEDDPIKGLLIAFWWLRLGQRKAMNLPVDPSAATRTRRDELRYADRVDEVRDMIIT